MPSASAACAMPFDRLRELVRDLRLLGVAEVEAVGEPDRLAAGARDVARRAEHRLHARGERVELAGSRSLQRDRDSAQLRPEPKHGGVEAGTANRARADELVVLLEDPRLVGEVLGARAASLCALRSPRCRACAARSRSADTRPSAAARESSRRSRRRACARSSPVSVTSPIGVHASSQRAHTRATASSICGRTTATIRSCDSEIMISHGSMPSSRSGTRSRCTSMPTPSPAISESEEASPAAPQSCSDSTSPDSTSSTETSISFLPVNGSPTCTVGRLSASSSPSSWLASTEAPPMPSRPVVAP